MNRNTYSSLLLGLVIASTTQIAVAQSWSDLWPSSQSRPADTKSSLVLKRAFSKAIATAQESTVQVYCDGKVASLGLVVDADGYVITKASEIVGPITVKLRDGKQVAGSSVGAVSAADIVLIKIEKTGLTPVKWGDANLLKVGQWVATPGMGKDPVAVGVVSVGRRKMPDKVGFLGVLIADSEGGARIDRVDNRTPAEKAGFQAGDLVVVAGGINVASRDDLIAVLRDAAPGDEMAFTVMREGASKELKAKLGQQSTIGTNPKNNPQNRFGGALSSRNLGFPAVFQHDTILTPNQCGGPLVTLDGSVIGINIARAGRTESYLLPADVIMPLVQQMKDGKYPANTKSIQTTERPDSANDRDVRAASTNNPTTAPSTLPSERPATRPSQP